MVDGQLRPNRVSDPRLLAAALDMPREAFLPAELETRAYADTRLKLAAGRWMLSPMVEAWLLGLVDLREADQVLVLPGMGGYLAALASRLAGSVTMVETEPALLGLARRALPIHAPQVRLVEGDPAAGAQGGAPYTVLVVEGMVERLPPAVLGQLSEGARVAVVLPTPGRGTGHLSSGSVVAGKLALRRREDAAASVVPEFAEAPSFAF